MGPGWCPVWASKCELCKAQPDALGRCLCIACLQLFQSQGWNEKSCIQLADSTEVRATSKPPRAVAWNLKSQADEAAALKGSQEHPGCQGQGVRWGALSGECFRLQTSASTQSWILFFLFLFQASCLPYEIGVGWGGVGCPSWRRVSLNMCRVLFQWNYHTQF